MRAFPRARLTAHSAALCPDGYGSMALPTTPHPPNLRKARTTSSGLQTIDIKRSATGASPRSFLPDRHRALHRLALMRTAPRARSLTRRSTATSRSSFPSARAA